MRDRVEGFRPIKNGGRYIIVVIDILMEIFSSINELIFCWYYFLEIRLWSTDVIFLIQILQDLLFKNFLKLWIEQMLLRWAYSSEDLFHLFSRELAWYELVALSICTRCSFIDLSFLISLCRFSYKFRYTSRYFGFDCLVRFILLSICLVVFDIHFFLRVILFLSFRMKTVFLGAHISRSFSKYLWKKKTFPRHNCVGKNESNHCFQLENWKSPYCSFHGKMFFFLTGFQMLGNFELNIGSVAWWSLLTSVSKTKVQSWPFLIAKSVLM